MNTVRRAIPVLMLAAAACAALPDLFVEPEVRLDRVVVRGVGLTGGNLDLMVKIYNPNAFDLRGTDLRVGFDVDGSRVGDVHYQDELGLQQGDTTLVTLPLAFAWSGVGSAVRTALQRGEVPYTMRGQVRVETPIGPRTVSFTRDGRVPLVQPGAASPGN